MKSSGIKNGVCVILHAQTKQRHSLEVSKVEYFNQSRNRTKGVDRRKEKKKKKPLQDWSSKPNLQTKAEIWSRSWKSPTRAFVMSSPIMGAPLKWWSDQMIPYFPYVDCCSRQAVIFSLTRQGSWLIWSWCFQVGLTSRKVVMLVTNGDLMCRDS